MWPERRPEGFAELAAQLGAPDADAWLEQLEPFGTAARNVCYVGSGAGRRALALAAAGWHVLCVERDKAAVAALQARLDHDERVAPARARIDVEAAPVEHAAFATTYDAVIAPDGVLNYPPDREGQRAVLAACATACRPGGAVMVDLVDPVPYLARISGAVPGPITSTPAVFPVDVGYERAWMSAEYVPYGADLDRQTVEFAAVYRIRWSDGEAREFVDPLRLRWLSPEELRLLASDAGLVVDGGVRRVDPTTWRATLRPAP